MIKQKRERGGGKDTAKIKRRGLLKPLLQVRTTSQSCHFQKQKKQATKEKNIRKCKNKKI